MPEYPSLLRKPQYLGGYLRLRRLVRAGLEPVFILVVVGDHIVKDMVPLTQPDENPGVGWARLVRHGAPCNTSADMATRDATGLPNAAKASHGRSRRTLRASSYPPYITPRQRAVLARRCR